MDTDNPTDVDFDPNQQDVFDSNRQDAEAALEALRAAISQPDHVFAQSSTVDPPQPIAPTLSSIDSTDQRQDVDKALVTILQLNNASQAVLDSMDRDYKDLQLLANVKTLKDYSRKIAETVKNLQQSFPQVIDPTLYDDTVSRAEHDALRPQYDALVAGKPGPSRHRPKRPAAVLEVDEGTASPGATSPVARDSVDKATIRKQRSVKLEHLVHKMANRRLGVQYAIQGFEVRGSRELPEPGTSAPSPTESANGVQEFRPYFRGEITSPEAKPFIDQVVDDCLEAWERDDGLGAGESIVMNREKMEEAVATYWIRLCKRWEEQQARIRGELHRDEITRKKQNQYRRQQSHLARRLASFDQSPLNLCKLRALYRSLLTIDFVPPTQDRPDPKRAYTEKEWLAYQKLANNGRAPMAHEVVDIWWLSPNVRVLLTILDTFAQDQATRIKRKGKPKQPAATFHLPPELWDRSTLPILRPKDANGLPVDKGGIILFRFHVSEQVQLENAEWAKGLYDDPPLGDTEAVLPMLDQIVNTGPYLHIKLKVKRAMEVAAVKLLPEGEIDDVLARPVPPEEPLAIPDPDAAARDLTAAEEFMSQNLEAFEALANNPLAFPEGLMGTFGALATGPSPGSSIRARKQNKRQARELPGGSAMPVAKKRWNGDAAGPDAEDDQTIDVKADLERDGEFLQTLN
ncbi:hypothetical protein BD324DRAFT_609586 [Kockovaella imperatae]|uniref:Uncharacterized protein n=1 Tax=Kockovaella imperatae TaxID=4999 RepID=A0A1Y1UBC6_9TREE|nr:hypothetical protein BD324DRAFT_609586 [Kockovaella imperatae]ORX35350.1 hypothetical protein BD324DRAFT_609586 [Kockovaella imperatae]